MAANYERLMRCKQTGEPLVKKRPRVSQEDRDMLKAMYEVLHRVDNYDDMVSFR